MEQFFKDISLSQIDRATMRSLDRPQSHEEVSKAITALQTNKSPGPDGFPVKFYKAIFCRVGTGVIEYV